MRVLILHLPFMIAKKLYHTGFSAFLNKKELAAREHSAFAILVQSVVLDLPVGPPPGDQL